jgi:phage baseplate assembly protein W
MALLFKGFNTIGQRSKFTLTDFDLIKRDLLNAFSIKAGEVPGRPEYGSIIHTLVFENMTNDIVEQFDAEVRRIIAGEPRVALQDLKLYAVEHIILAEVFLDTIPDSSPEKLILEFDTDQKTVNLI